MFSPKEFFIARSVNIMGSWDMRFLFMAFHYPKPEYRADLLQWIERVGAALKAQPGLLELADFDDTPHGRIVAVSIWDSAEHFRLGREGAMNSLSEAVPYDIWEMRPLENFPLSELKITPDR